MVVKIPKPLFLETMRKSNTQKLHHQMCSVNSIAVVADLLTLEPPKSIFSADNLAALQAEMKSDFLIYNVEDGYYIPLYKRNKPKYQNENTIHISINTNTFGGSAEITHFHLILNLAHLQQTYICRLTPKCRYKTTHLSHFLRHQENCLENSEQKVISVQSEYGNFSSPVEQLIHAGYLPGNAINFRKTCFRHGSA